MRITAISLLFLTTLIVFTPSRPAMAAQTFFDVLWNVFFGVPDTGPKPEETLQAPFSYDQAMETNGKIAGEPQAGSLTHPHAAENDISRWLVTTVSEALTYDASAAKDPAGQGYESKKKNFTPGGFNQYMQFLQANNITKVIDSERFHIKSFVEDRPLLLNAVAHEGRYRWLYEIPVMVSYMDAKNFNYKETNPVNQKIMLTVQLGRAKDSGNDMEVLIETWNGKSQKVDKR